MDANPKTSSEETKARKPLAGAKVTVVPNEENPGYYSASVWLRPHFQLEGMDIGMSLVASLRGAQELMGFRPGSDAKGQRRGGNRAY